MAKKIAGFLIPTITPPTLDFKSVLPGSFAAAAFANKVMTVVKKCISLIPPKITIPKMPSLPSIPSLPKPPKITVGKSGKGGIGA